MIPSTNQEQQLPDGAVFLPGLWWMDGNPVSEVVTSSFPMKYVSGTCPGSDCILKSPLFGTRAWAYLDNEEGAKQMNENANLPESIQDAHVAWLNESYAEVVENFGYMERLTFVKVSDDHYIRKSYCEGPLAFYCRHLHQADGYQYDLRQIVYGNGTSNPENWKMFIESPDGAGKLTVFGSDDPCKRKCVGAENGCTACKAACNGDSGYYRG